MKDCWAGDIALCELLDGETEAPSPLLDGLVARGYVDVSANGRASLTAAGRQRAEQIRADPGFEHDLRLMFAGARAGGGPAIKTVAGGSMRIGGGAATIRA